MKLIYILCHKVLKIIVTNDQYQGNWDNYKSKQFISLPAIGRLYKKSYILR